MQEAWAYSHDGPIRRGKRGPILTADQSDAGSVSSSSDEYSASTTSTSPPLKSDITPLEECCLRGPLIGTRAS
eukprot:7487214-Pyramimonas_sp.AAC.1